MPQHRWTIILIALLLSACGAAQPSEQPAAAPTQPAATAPTAVPTAAPTAAPPTEAPTVAPTAELFRADPTAPVVLPPTTAPTQAAQPTTRPASQQDGQSREPTRIVIDAVAIDQKIVSVGLDKNRVPVVPNHDVGWYNLSAQPGRGDNIVFWGHVLRFRQTPKIPAPFARLKEVKPGAKIVIYDQGGNTHTYVVKEQVWALPNEVEYILPKDKEMITLVSCIGDKVIDDGEVVDESHRLITIAEPAG
jgi:sortase (surface protein transpeptidase)